MKKRALSGKGTSFCFKRADPSLRKGRPLVSAEGKIGVSRSSRCRHLHFRCAPPSAATCERQDLASTSGRAAHHSLPASAFDHGNGEEARFHLDQVEFVGDDFFDVLVGTGGFLHVVLAADGVDNTFGFEGGQLFGHVERFDGDPAAEGTSCSMRAGVERFGIAQPFDDVGGCALRTGDDARCADRGEGGPFAVHDDAFAEVLFERSIVVGDVDHRVKLDAGQHFGQHLLDALHHQAAVAVGEVHAIEHFFPIQVKLRRTLGQERQTQIGRNGRVPARVEIGRNLVVVIAHAGTEVARTGVEHHPEVAGFVLLEFDEVVAAAERPDFLGSGDLPLLDDDHILYIVSGGQKGFILRHLVTAHTDGDALADAAHDFLAEHIGRDVTHLPTRPEGAHAAPDVHAHGVGDDDVFAGQHAADGHSHSGVDIGHESEVVEEEGQSGEVFDLTQGRVFHVVGPNFYDTMVDELFLHDGFLFEGE